MEIETIKKLLDIKKNVALTPQEMVKSLSVTFFPQDCFDEEINNFSKNLEKVFLNLGVKIVPYKDALTRLTLKQKIKLTIGVFGLNLKIIFYKLGFKNIDENIKNLKFPFFIKFGPKIKKGIAIVVAGQGKTGSLSMDYLINLRENPIITILKEPKEINKNSSYLEHMNVSLNLFAFHMTNLVIIVNENEWAIYSLNGSHPYFPINENFTENVLSQLIPKISAPVVPPSMKDFIFKKGAFNVNDIFYKPYIDDLINGGILLDKTGLYPKKRQVADLNFRNNFYKWIGSRYLDKRNGMSYGFVARQLPTKLSDIILQKNDANQEFFEENKNIFLNFKLLGKTYFLKVPDVWVLTSRSGSDKSNLNKEKDIIKMGLVSGKMVIETPAGANIKGDYKPSFDTRVILAHALGNALLASLIKYFKPEWQIYKNLEKNGVAIAHWHGYIKNEFLKEKTIIYGSKNPSVSCSSFQSAIYAFSDKISEGVNCLEKNIEYNKEIHIEQHHGVNVVYESLTSLANFILSNPNISKL